MTLNHFAAFELLNNEPGKQALRKYYIPYLQLAERYRVSFILETPAWRANPDWVVVYLYRPVRYIVDEKHVTIKRPVNDVIIPINEIRDALLVKKESLGRRERVGGNGGVFGFYGNFRN